MGVGTWKLNDVAAVREVLKAAASQGHFLIDTAAAYGNEIAIAKAVRELEIPREQIFIQDKLWNTNRGYQEAQEACKKSLRKLKMDYLDAYLIHWPASPELYGNWEEMNGETWRGKQRIKKEGLARIIGVCNFKQRHLERLKQEGGEMPEINQTEFHPGYHSEGLLYYCQENGILVEAGSPLGNGQILGSPILLEVARRHGKSPAQICLRWAVERGLVVIPKTSKAERVTMNRDIFGFSLTEEERERIDGMGYCGGIGIDADEVTEFG